MANLDWFGIGRNMSESPKDVHRFLGFLERPNGPPFMAGSKTAPPLFTALFVHLRFDLLETIELD